MMLGRLHRVGHEHGDRQWPNSAGYRSVCARQFFHVVRIHVADQLSIGLAIGADIDDRGAGANELRCQESGL